MIIVQAYHCISTNDFVIKVNGHAGFAPEGQDPICASASSYARQAIIIAQVLFKEGKLEKRPRIAEERGRVVVVMRPHCLCIPLGSMTIDDEFEYTEIVAEIRTVVSGFDWLAKNYPEFIKLEDDIHNC